MILTEKATGRKPAAHWEEEEERTLVLYLEQKAAAAGDGANFAKKHFIGAAQHLKDNFTVKRGGEKTANASHTKWGNLKEDFYAVQSIKSASGLSWCDTNGAGMEKTDTVWVGFVKVFKHAEHFRNKGFPLYDIIEKMVPAQAKGTHV
ncbi:hypothetical protein SCLCIDRAFT_123214, partial [Scleroderma citrinum Foug A]